MLVTWPNRNTNMTLMISGRSVTFRLRFLEVGRVVLSVGQSLRSSDTPPRLSKNIMTRRAPQRRSAQRCRVGTVGETLFVRQTYNVAYKNVAHDFVSD